MHGRPLSIISMNIPHVTRVARAAMACKVSFGGRPETDAHTNNRRRQKVAMQLL